MSLSNFNTSEGVVVDFCEECFGIWLDKGELGNYIELSSDIPELEEMRKKAKPTDLICPKCKGKLTELPFSSKTKIMVDRCDNCEGIFLDKGELGIAEHAAASIESVDTRILNALKIIKAENFQVV